MPRGRMCRRVWREPCFNRFGPVGMGGAEATILGVDEFEALRLTDLEGMGQKEASEKMDISQPTLCRILESARKKVADAIVNGKQIRIEGGEYMVEEKGMPKRDGTGMGKRANRGRGGCTPPQDKGVAGAGCPRRGMGRGRGAGRGRI